MKFLLIFIVMLFFLSFVSATKLGITPGNLIFNGSVNEKICSNLTLSTDYNGILIGESKWIEKAEKKRDIKDYNLNADDLNINIVFPESINISKNIMNVEVCIISERSGKYNGAIVYRTADSYAGVGSWIEADIFGNNPNSDKGFEKISGASVGIVPKNISRANLILTISLIALLFIFIALFVIYKKKVK
jgi:hypothetical protein